MGSLLDKRYIRYDNSLVISAFKEHEFEPEIHATVYKCQAANPWGSIVSRDVVISAGKFTEACLLHVTSSFCSRRARHRFEFSAGWKISLNILQPVRARVTVKRPKYKEGYR